MSSDSEGVAVRRGAGGRGVDPRDASAPAPPPSQAVSTSARMARLAPLHAAFDLGLEGGGAPEVASLMEGAMASDPELRAILAEEYTAVLEKEEAQMAEARRRMPDMLRAAEVADAALPETVAVLREAVRRRGGYPPGPPLNRTRRRTRSHVTGAKHFPQWVRQRLADRAARLAAPCGCPQDLLDSQHMAYPHHREPRGESDEGNGGEGGDDDIEEGKPGGYKVYRVQKRRGL